MVTLLNSWIAIDLLLTILLGVSSSTSAAFQHDGRHRRSNENLAGACLAIEATLLSVKKLDNEEEVANENGGVNLPSMDRLLEDTNAPPPSTNRNNKIIVPPSVRKALDAVNLVYSAAMISVGIALSLGLLLNVMGYGYQLRDGAFRIDTLQQLRIESQFEREIKIKIKER